MCSSLICRWDFDFIFYSFWDINDNYFNWPINQLKNLPKFFKYSPIHAPCAQVQYTVEIFDFIFYSFWDINDNYFNWPINQLRYLQKFFKYSLLHAPSCWRFICRLDCDSILKVVVYNSFPKNVTYHISIYLCISLISIYVYIRHKSGARVIEPSWS